MITRILARSSLAVLAICLLGAAATASETQEIAALRAARAWLAVVDAGNYDDSWKAAAGYFRTAISKEQWRQAMQGVRRPLGNVLARELKGKTAMTELPGAPDCPRPFDRRGRPAHNRAERWRIWPAKKRLSPANGGAAGAGDRSSRAHRRHPDPAAHAVRR